MTRILNHQQYEIAHELPRIAKTSTTKMLRSNRAEREALTGDIKACKLLVGSNQDALSVGLTYHDRYRLTRSHIVQNQLSTMLRLAGHDEQEVARSYWDIAASMIKTIWSALPRITTQAKSQRSLVTGYLKLAHCHRKAGDHMAAAMYARSARALAKSLKR